MAKSTTIAKGRSAERREARRAEAIDAAAISTNSGAPLSLLGVDGSMAMTALDLLGGICPGAVGLGAGLESQILLHHRLFIYLFTYR